MSPTAISISSSSSQRVLSFPYPPPKSHKMAEPAWQETLRLRLVERNARESTYAPIIEQCAYTSLASDLLFMAFTDYPDFPP